MALSVRIFLLFSLIFLIHTSVSHKPILPKAAIIPITKDLTTHQYAATVKMGPNLDPVKLVLDLNGPHTWVDCGVIDSALSSHQKIGSFSLKCSMAKSTSDCFSRGGEAEDNSKICSLQAENTVTKTFTSGELSETVMGVEFHDGGVSSGSFAGNEQFLLLCASNLLLEGLANGARGMLGLGNSRISLPSQFPTKFGFLQRRFSLCLSSSSDGVVSLGGKLLDSTIISNSMMYTPLVSNSNRNGLQRGYYMNVNSINISGKKVSLVPKGSLETKLSTVLPYTILGSKIYGTFVEAYVKAATYMNMTLVPPVAPFEVCFSSKGVENKRVGPNVPIIELVLQSEIVKWKIHGRNSMVHVGDGVMCLGFLNGGLNLRDSIVLGGYQIEDYVLDFDLENNLLGFSSPSLMGDKRCSDFAASGSSRVSL